MDEFICYGDRIINVHVKDRKFGGSTIELGRGDADFGTVFSLLNRQKYSGNYILQTARANDGQHVRLLEKSRDFVIVGSN